MVRFTRNTTFFQTLTEANTKEIPLKNYTKRTESLGPILLSTIMMVVSIQDTAIWLHYSHMFILMKTIPVHLKKYLKNVM